MMIPWRLIERRRRPTRRRAPAGAAARRSPIPGHVRRRRRTAACLLLVPLYLAAALWVCRPGLRTPYVLLPSGASTSATVPMLNAWSIWWNADRLAHGFRGYWDAPIFFPERGTFAFSEPQPATLLVAPVVWLTGSPLPAYHVYLIGSLVLNGIFGVRLLRVLGVGWPAAVIGGLAILFHPLVHEHKEVVQLIPLWGVLWALEALLKLRDRTAVRGGIALGIAFAAVFMTSVHHGLLFSLLLAATVWITVSRAAWRHHLRGGAVAAATAVLLLLPLLAPMHGILSGHAFSRDEAVVASLSATASDWLQVPQQALVSIGAGEPPSVRPLSPGWLRTLLAAGVVLGGLRGGRHRRALLFLAAFGGVALLCSFGQNLRLGGWVPWLTLADSVAPFGQVRSVYRFAYFAQLAVLVLAAAGFDAVWHYLDPARRRHWSAGGLSVAIVGGLGALVALEIPPRSGYWMGVPDVSEQRPWASFVECHTPEGRGIVCLPIGDGYTAAQLEPSARWMLYGTQHGVPLVNGYSGFFPESWFRMVEVVGADPFGAPALARLADHGVEFVVIDTGRMRAAPRVPAAPPAAPLQLRRVFRDASGVEVWQLVRPPLRD